MRSRVYASPRREPRRCGATTIRRRIASARRPGMRRRMPRALRRLATGSLRVRVRFPAAAGGRPCPGILVRVWRGGPWSSPDHEAGLRSEATDLAGEARFEGLSPGEAPRVMLPSQEPGNFIPATSGVRVEAGREATLDAEFSGARAVEGRVVDALGSPIAGAVILTSSESWNWNATQDHRVVGSSGVDGRFVIDTLGHESLVAVLARGFARTRDAAHSRAGELRIASDERARCAACAGARCARSPARRGIGRRACARRVVVARRG